METKRLLMLIEDPYIKAAGPFTNTCVLDSLLAALHTTYILYPNIEDLMDKNDFFRTVMSLLKDKKYIETRDLCVKGTNLGKVNLKGNIRDYFPLFAKLPCEEIPYKQTLPKDNAIYKEIPSKLKDCGDVIVLGNPFDPTLILVHREVHNDLYQDCKNRGLPPFVDDEKRCFALQFLLLGKNEHMTMCFQSSEDKWHLYDNDPTQPSFQPFDLKSLKEYGIYLAGYVNKAQGQQYKHSIPETGEVAGAMPFNSGAHSSNLDPVENMEWECSCPLSIPETRDGLGTKPILPIVSNQEHQVEDTEMPTCSSSDSD
ncbi:uncharacterized protein Hap1MRO34_020909 [Clarias gariepinus]|uniref:uncharacterized protein LOC128509297 n=1 Tax=Clarias gariepinus TaxID=13013 RepID=UPI00234C3E05|nr:uncharacterized protein LOC128509297 [Clarias gariepinus]